MAKKIIKEIIIMLLISLALLLALSVLLYKFIPSNKIIPSEANYVASEKTKELLSEAVDADQTEIILRYEITSNDLKNYQKTNSYNPGKVNPFASASSEVEENKDNNNNSNNTTGNNQTNNNSTGNNTTGKFFETTPSTK